MILTPLQTLLAFIIVAVGAAVQASIGFGMAMIAAPVLYLIDPQLVPGPLIACALILSIWVSWIERHAIDFSHFKAAIAGRLIGSPIAALLLGSLSAFAFDLVFSSLVLLAVVLSVIHPKIEPTTKTIFAATLLSGLMGTLSSIGGPPLALVYQHARGATLRANLSILFVLGTIVSLISLHFVERYGMAELQVSFWMCLALLPGIAVSKPLKRYVASRSVRPYLLALCALSAAVVLLRAVLEAPTLT